MPGTALTVSELVGYLKVDSSAWRRGLVEARAELVKAAHDSSSDLAKMADRTERLVDQRHPRGGSLCCGHVLWAAAGIW